MKTFTPRILLSQDATGGGPADAAPLTVEQQEIAILKQKLKILTQENDTLSDRIKELTTGIPKARRTPHFSTLPKAEQEAKVMVEAAADVSVDGVKFSKGQRGQVMLKQYHALSAYLLRVAAILLLCTLALASAQAQVTQTAGPPSSFGSISLPATVLPATGVTNATPIYWSPQTNAAGIPTNIISLTRFDEVYLSWYMTNVTVAAWTNYLTLCGGDGGTNWDTNHIVCTLTNIQNAAGGPGIVCSNLSRNLLGSCGYLFVNSIYGVGGPTVPATTNGMLKLQAKPIRSGQ